MFKVAGSIFVLVSSIFIFCQKVLKCFFTYKFLLDTVDIIQKIQFESSANLIYTKLYENINFDKNIFFENAKANAYIEDKEITLVQSFFEELGKRDKMAEHEYVDYNLKKFIASSQEYLKKYSEIKKTHFICGVAAGLFIIIFLI
ncbi:MAG: hypothetical protein E7483_00595 [Ruminococcaceae bacterium]|nr:hypothetical protein [Oscillospiraceae bacterium]